MEKQCTVYLQGYFCSDLTGCGSQLDSEATFMKFWSCNYFYDHSSSSADLRITVVS